MKTDRVMTIVMAVSAICFVGDVSRADLVAHWTFDDGAGVDVSDSSGNGNTLTFGALPASWNATGAFGGSVTLTGQGALARAGSTNPGTISNFQLVTGNEVTISFWAQSASESQRSNPFYIGSSAGGQGNRVLSSHLEWSDGNIYWDVDWGDGSNQRVSGAGGNTADQLHHYVMTYDGNSGLMQVFKDNALFFGGNAGVDASINWAGIQNVEVGAFSFDGFWQGTLDDFAIWNETLDTAAIDQIHRNGVAVLPSLETLVDEKFADGNVESRGWTSVNGTLEDWSGTGGASARGLATTYDHDNNPGTPNIDIMGGIEVLDSVDDNTVALDVQLPGDLDPDIDGVLSFFAANRISGNFGGNGPEVEVYNLTDDRLIASAVPSYADGNANWTFNQLLVDFSAFDLGDMVQLRFSDFAVGSGTTARGLQIADVQFTVGRVPEPVSFVLFGLSAVFGVLIWRRRR